MTSSIQTKDFITVQLNSEIFRQWLYQQGLSDSFMDQISSKDFRQLVADDIQKMIDAKRASDDKYHEALGYYDGKSLDISFGDPVSGIQSSDDRYQEALGFQDAGSVDYTLPPLPTFSTRQRRLNSPASTSTSDISITYTDVRLHDDPDDNSQYPRRVWYIRQRVDISDELINQMKIYTTSTSDKPDSAFYDGKPILSDTIYDVIVSSLASYKKLSSRATDLLDLTLDYLTKNFLAIKALDIPLISPVLFNHNLDEDAFKESFEVVGSEDSLGWIHNNSAVNILYHLKQIYPEKIKKIAELANNDSDKLSGFSKNALVALKREYQNSA